jgi:hypothetical protein
MNETNPDTQRRGHARRSRATLVLLLGLGAGGAAAFGRGGADGASVTQGGGSGTHAGGGAAGGAGAGGLTIGTVGSGAAAGAGGNHGTTGAGGVHGTGGGATGSAGSGGVAIPTAISPCQGHVYQCGDLIDNDGDGLVDQDDPDCLGPCDNTEGSLYGGIPGQAGPECIVDCYFDQDSGPGNDDCYWNHRCDPHEVAPDYTPEARYGAKCAYDPKANTPGTPETCSELYAAQSKQCHDFCGPLTPNGCDCFGCCNLPSGTDHWIWLGSEDDKGNGTCTLDAVNDPTKCQPCEPVAGCLNPCGECEICIGKSKLPPQCYPPPEPDAGAGGGGPDGGGPLDGGTDGGGGGAQQCPAGVQACGQPGQAPCPAKAYCITGCCQFVPW